jgi:tellurite resistance protein
MQATEQRSLLSIALLAALADGHKADREREAIQRFAQTLSAEGGAALADVYPDVLLGRMDVRKAAEGLSEPAHRQLAYEIAVCVCDADGQHSAAEKQFLDGLKVALGLSNDEAAQLQGPADEIAAVPIGGPAAAEPVAPTAAPAPAAGPVVAATPKVPRS